jgi:hypothetical protein
VNVGRYATVNLHLDHDHPTIHYNMGGGNKNERLGGRCNVGCGSMSGLDRINGFKKLEGARGSMMYHHRYKCSRQNCS